MSQHSDDLKELAAALASAQAAFSAVPKESFNPFFKSKYADLADVVKAAAPIITSHGLSVAQFLGHDEGGDTLTTWLLHSSGQFISESMRLHLTKTDSQGHGSATTYARRYAYMAALGLVSDEDNDGNGKAKLARGRTEVATTRRAAPTPATRPTVDNDGVIAETRAESAALRSEAAKGDPLLTEPQGRMIARLFGKLAITDRQERLDYLSGQFGRTFSTSKELTKTEATSLIEHLMELAGEEPRPRTSSRSNEPPPRDEPPIFGDYDDQPF